VRVPEVGAPAQPCLVERIELTSANADIRDAGVELLERMVADHELADTAAGRDDRPRRDVIADRAYTSEVNRADDWIWPLFELGYPAGDWFMLVHTEHDEYRDAIAALDGVRFWPWYSAERPPAGVTEQQWAHREAVWAEVVPNPFSLSGLRFELFTEFHQLRARDVLDQLQEFIPNLDQRAGTVASHHTRIADVVDGQLVMRDIDAITAARDAKRAEVLPGLVPTVTVEQLQAPYSAG